MPARKQSPASTQDDAYAHRLAALQQVWWKRILPVQAPYRWNLRRLDLGFTLDLGCGIGRNLDHLRGNGVGIDHNQEAVAIARAGGFAAFTPAEFLSSPYARPKRFDALLLAPVAEHMDDAAVVELLRAHVGFLRPGAKVVIITPQERGYRSDPSHVQFMDFTALESIAAATGLEVGRTFSFPFPRWTGSLFVYNEFVLVSTLPH